jgi:hypothetical protein
LWLASLPVRLAQAHFAARVLELGEDARRHGDYLGGLALAVGAAFVLSLWARAVFARACVLRLRSTADPGALPLRTPLGTLLGYVYAALLVEVLFYLTCAVPVVAPFFVLLAGLLAATVPESEGVGLLRPFARLFGSQRQVLPLVGVTAVFFAALVLTAANLSVLFQLGLWLAGGVAGLETTRWAGLLSFGHPRYLCVLLAGAVLIVEPYWLASLVVFVHKLESRTTGEDLRLWFDRLRSTSA